MPRYTLLQQAYIHDVLRAPGSIVDVADDFVPGPHMVPYVDNSGIEDPAARAAKDKAGETALPAPGDPDYLGRLIAQNIKDGRTDGDVSVSSQFTPAPMVVLDENGVVRGVRDAAPIPLPQPAGALLIDASSAGPVLGVADPTPVPAGGVAPAVAPAATTLTSDASDDASDPSGTKRKKG